jgi:DNA modification methylase
MINKIILGHALNVLPKLPAESISCITTSPPYWGLRDYGIDPVIWDGDKNCKHVWVMETKKAADNRRGVGTRWQHKDSHYPNENPESYPNRTECYKHKVEIGFCQKCGAWKGSLGLEPTFELYIKHLCDIFDEVKRVLRKDGTCWVNIGDSYATSPAGNKTIENNPMFEKGGCYRLDNYRRDLKKDFNIVPAKSLCDIPHRFSIEMTNRGWIKRNTIIWHKPNCMPSSANDRFTLDFEYLFFFTKNNKAIFWTNEKTLECVSKKPLGAKGIEGKDWEWQETQNWKEEENAGYEIGATDPHRAASIGGLKLGTKHKKSGKLKKVSLWTGHDYWFEQQFEAWTDTNINDTKRAGKYIQYGGKHKDSKDNKGVVVGDPKQGRNKRCVWVITTQPFPEAHFAVYPEGLIEIPIKAGCPEFVCKKCGKARVKILEPSEEYKNLLNQSWTEDTDKDKKLRKKIGFKANTKKVSCTADYRSFMGAGTTALVALKQRKRFVGIEIKQEYIDMAKRRIAKVQQRIF